MATQVQWRGGSTAEHATFTGAAREVTVDTQKQTLVVHDGSTAGGEALLREDQANLPGSVTNGIYTPGTNQVAVATNGTGRLFVDANGNVGVGASPTSLFSVRGNTPAINIDDELNTSSKLVFRPAVLGYAERAGFSINYSTGEFRQFSGASAAGYFQTFYTDGSERLRITSAGLVGIGTSAPSSKLDVTVPVNNPSTGSPSAGSFITARGNTATVGYGPSFFLANNSGAKETFWRISAVTASGNNGDLVFNGYNGGADYPERLRITAGGLVGIGTTSPAYAFVVSAAGASGIEFGPAYSGTANLIQHYSRSGFVYVDAVNDAAQHRFQISGTERARIDSSGRLLVGTSTNFDQSAPLQVNSSTGESANLYVFGADNSRVNIGSARGSVASPSTLNSVDTIGGIYFRGHDGTSFKTGAQIQAQIDGIAPSSDLPSRLTFSTTADGASSPTERMRITSDGKTLVNQNATYAACNGQLSVESNSASTAAPTLGLVNPSATAAWVSFSDSATVYGSITRSGSSTVYATSSDYRLKENVAPASDGITRLQQLKPSRFNFIADPDTVVDGFLAHEVQAVVPECVTGTKDEVDGDGKPVYQGIDQSKLVPLLTAALQEAIGRIETLEAEVAALKAQ